MFIWGKTGSFTKFIRFFFDNYSLFFFLQIICPISNLIIGERALDVERLFGAGSDERLGIGVRRAEPRCTERARIRSLNCSLS